MKYLKLEEKLPTRAGLPNLNTVSLVTASVNDMPGGGKLDEQRARLRVLDALDRVNGSGVLALEDADARTLQKCAAGATWTLVHPGIVAFCDAVANMTDTPPEARAPSEA